MFAQNTAKADDPLIESERKLNRAFASGDPSAFVALVAKDAVWENGSGFIPVALLIDHIGEVKLTDPKVENPKVLWADANTAVVISVWTGSGTAFGAPFVTKVASTVWTRRTDKWIALYHHDSNAPPQ
jgi:hypothetical protein